MLAHGIRAKNCFDCLNEFRMASRCVDVRRAIHLRGPNRWHATGIKWWTKNVVVMMNNNNNENERWNDVHSTIRIPCLRQIALGAHVGQIQLINKWIRKKRCTRIRSRHRSGRTDVVFATKKIKILFILLLACITSARSYAALGFRWHPRVKFESSCNLPVCDRLENASVLWIRRAWAEFV